MICRDINWRTEGCDANISAIGDDRDGGCRRNGNRQIGSSAVDGRNVQAQTRSTCFELWRELLCAGVSLGVGSGVDLLVSLNVNLVIVACAGYGDVSPRVINGQRHTTADRLGDRLIALVLISQKLIHIVRIEIEMPPKRAFMKAGCWQCHGTVGQGAVTGPRLAPDPMPYETFAAFVRTSSRAMPPYREKVLSEADLADIYAYLQSVPRPPEVKSLPLLHP